jgi:hypothetical protein
MFDPEKIYDFSYLYISTLDEKYKKQKGNYYTNDMRRCDIKIPVKPKIAPWMKYNNMMEIVNQVSQDFASLEKSGERKK